MPKPRIVILAGPKGAGKTTASKFLLLDTVRIGVFERVAARVKAGGHNIQASVITRRFYRSLSNLFELYIPLVNRWRIFDNYAEPPALVASGARHEKTVALERKWKNLNELAQEL